MKAQELLDQFIQEARECLEQVGSALLQVERNPSDADLLNHLFRLVHTLKGNCGLFDFKPLELVLHAGEDLLDQVRSSELPYSDDMADALLMAMDFAVVMVQDIANTGQTPAAAIDQATAIALALRTHLAHAQQGPAPAALDAAPAAPAATLGGERGEVSAMPPAPAWLAAIPPQLLAAHPHAVAWRYVPEEGCFFKGEDPWLYASQSPQLLHLAVQSHAPWPQDLAQWDCYSCNLELIALSAAPMAEVEAHFRYVPEQLTAVPVAPWAAPAPASTNPDPLAILCDDAPEVLSALRDAAHALWAEQFVGLAQPQVPPGTVQAARAVFAALLRSVGEPAQGSAHDAPSPTLAQQLQALGPQTSALELLQWAQQWDLRAPDWRAAAAPPSAPSTAMPTPCQPSASKGAALEDNASHKQLKVSQEKVDRLMDLIGEMVVAKNALPYLAQRAEQVFQQRELAREIKAQYAVINRIAEDMQHAIMQVRMLPVGAVFQRFHRLVRDISKKLGKEVELHIEGEDTEADKNVIESLAEPLIHILRNSLDHGLEMPDVRAAAGKPARGRITVQARQESDRVVIEIADDGAGVNAERVRAKAVERGLIAPEGAQQLSDEQAVQLVFLPGFSTADHISDLSGRGVGMDAVRSAVERINGQVQLRSTAGQGTHIRLSLPLSMAITNVMVIEAGGRRFGVPMDWIVETVRVHVQDIHHFKHSQTTVLRGKIVLLQALHHLLELGSEPIANSQQELAVLVVRLGSEHLGLLVDHFHGATDILLKPLEGVLAGISSFAGTALMGDGSVLMVLNPKELL